MSVFMDSGGIALEFTSYCYFLLLHFSHLQFLFFHRHFLKAKKKKNVWWWKIKTKESFLPFRTPQGWRRPEAGQTDLWLG